MLAKLPAIAAVDLSSRELTYHWDEWDVQQYCAPPEPGLAGRMAALSGRANIAMGIACGEWLVHRYDVISSDPMPLQYLEAAWASIVNPLYCRYNETVDDEWRGVVRGPMHLMLTCVVDLVFGTYDDTNAPGAYAGYVSRLTEHILPDNAQAAFATWREGCLMRLEAEFGAPPEDPDDLFGDELRLGPWLPRELFDLGRQFDPGQTRALLGQFLSQLDPTQNPYLRGPDELNQLRDFTDTPYQLPSHDRWA